MMLDFNNLKAAVAELDEEKVLELLNDFVAANPTPEEAQKAIEACQSGMAAVGELFEKKEYFVGVLIFAAFLISIALETL